MHDSQNSEAPIGGKEAMRSEPWNESADVKPRHAAAAAAAAAMSQQPRGKRIPNVLSEFERVVWVEAGMMPKLDHKMCTTTSLPEVPLGSKFVYLKVGEWVMGTSELKYVACDDVLTKKIPEFAEYLLGIHARYLSGGKNFEKDIQMNENTLCGLGIYRSPQAWHEQSKLLPFPADVSPFVRPWHAKALKIIYASSPLDLVEFRKQRLMDLVDLAKQFESKESEFKKKLAGHAVQTLKNKKLVLFGYLLDKIGINGTRLVEAIGRGFDLVGGSFHVDLFPAHFVKPGKGRDDLQAESPWRIKYALSLTRSSGDPELDIELYNKTVKEKSEGSMSGPFSQVDLDRRFGAGRWVPARRFGVWQSSAGVRKLRPIDDFSFNFHNATVEVQERLDHGGLDEIGALAILIKRSLLVGSFSFVDTDNVKHDFKIHDGWHGTSKSLKGKTLDLKAAYKQLCVSHRDLCFSVTTVYNPNIGEPEFWLCTGLPFGSTSSVYAFNACSRAIERLLCEHMGVLASSYFDDYPSLEVADTAVSAKGAMEGLQSVLGWDFVKEQHKYVEYSSEFRVLGALLNLEGENVVVRNVPERMSSIQETCDELLASESWRKYSLDKLLGRCSFARAYIMGRPLNIPMAVLYSAISKERVSIVPTPDEVEAVALVRGFASSSRPRVFPCSEYRHPTLLYTDGACESEGSSFGAVLFQVGRAAQVIEGRVPDNLVSRWRRLNVRHAIAQVELLPVLLSLNTWQHTLVGCDLLLFTDNSSVKEGLVTGTSRNLASRELLLHIALALVGLHGRI